MIKFSVPPITGDEIKYISDSLKKGSISGDGYYTKLCEKWFEDQLEVKKFLLTSSCTHSLEMAALMTDIGPNDEVIMPSYTFVSTANAFALRGAKIVFVDIRPDTLNIDESKIEAAITPKTKAIVPVHYAGVSCNMHVIKEIADKYKLWLIEDAAQACFARYQGEYVGTVGDIAAISFHDTKNITSGGEGGGIIVNNAALIGRAEIIRQKGTNRAQFIRGEIEKYSWVDLGSSYLMSDIQAAFLFAQLKNSQLLQRQRDAIWQRYYASLETMRSQGFFSLPEIPKGCNHNSHIFYIIAKSKQEKLALQEMLKDCGVQAPHHYVPLHDSIAGKKYGRFSGKDRHTTELSSRILRLPLHREMSLDDVDSVVAAIKKYYSAAKTHMQSTEIQCI